LATEQYTQDSDRVKISHSCDSTAVREAVDGDKRCSQRPASQEFQETQFYYSTNSCSAGCIAAALQCSPLNSFISISHFSHFYLWSSCECAFVLSYNVRECWLR